jgi:glycine C-acetyltransferase
MYTMREHLQKTLAEIGSAGLTKRERPITSPQGASVRVVNRPASLLNLCANNYLGLANHPRIVAAAKEAMDRHGFGLASVRFICGTQDIHQQLERKLSEFLGTQSTILYSSCFDANTGLFETILGEEDAVISDELNHASIIDGIRLCKAQRYRYRNNDPADLREKLSEATKKGARYKLIATDGVFSMDGTIANLPAVCDAAEEFGAMVVVDDSHAVGVLGPAGRGTAELHGVTDRIDIFTGTLGKALGGASGGYVSGRAEVIDLLRQRSRPYLFSNTVAPAVVGASLAAIELVQGNGELRQNLANNTRFFRRAMTEAGLNIVPGEHPIVPVMFGDARRAAAMAERMLELGVYVVAFSYPVVPMGKARIRCQVSAAHSRDDLEFAVAAFKQAAAELA